ncbi:MAG: M24 family metallopeptidase, partial [Candidatus Cryosericum sp.]
TAGHLADTAFRGKLAENGLGFGHSVGLEFHENPRFSPYSDTALVSGCVMTVEPGVNVADHFGMCIEDTVIVTENGCTPVTDLGKDLVITRRDIQSSVSAQAGALLRPG